MLRLIVDGKEFTVRELASQEMKNSAGATWDAATAGNAIGTWEASFGDQIDIVVSNNDGMGMSMFNAWQKITKFLHSDMMQTVTLLQQSLKDTAEQSLSMQMFRLI